MLDKIKVLLGLTDETKDTLLTILIEQAIEEAIDYTHNEECINTINSTIIQMVVYKYNRIGTEGLDSEGYSGVSFAYTADYPESIMRALKAKRRIRTV